MKFARIRNVEILASAHVVWELVAQLQIVILFAIVLKDSRVIHSLDVFYFVSFHFFNFFNHTNILKRFSFNISMKFVAPIPPEPINVCQPSPCGPNAQCQILENSPSCTCLPDFIGSPPNCRPECISNSECPSYQACVNQKCKDPCIGSCGENAQCRTVSHTPMCYCETDYTGDPFTQCFIKPSKLSKFT